MTVKLLGSTYLGPDLIRPSISDGQRGSWGGLGPRLLGKGQDLSLHSDQFGAVLRISQRILPNPAQLFECLKRIGSYKM